jgi:hypothetical protein
MTNEELIAILKNHRMDSPICLVIDGFPCDQNMTVEAVKNADGKRWVSIEVSSS